MPGDGLPTNLNDSKNVLEIVHSYSDQYGAGGGAGSATPAAGFECVKEQAQDVRLKYEFAKSVE
ncbi:MAG: hypothetical protein KF752_13520 [Pirellulaceae bacterium]|nr:hypothetical protein [Pirellulaceae bacterium]